MNHTPLFVVGIIVRSYPHRMHLVQRAIEILDHLVAFDTTSHKSNKPMVSWIKTYLERHGVSVTLLEEATGLKQNLIATVGENTAGGIVLSGHTDVVPAEKKQWTSDPFKLRLDEGKLFGRGTTDMKGFLSIALAAIPDMTERDLKQPITLAFTYDEEVGCLGTPGLVEHLRPGQRVIVGEPTSLAPGVQHKGGRVQSLKIAGVSAHSGMPDLGVNAVSYVAQALGGIAELEQSFAQADSDYETNLVVSRINGGSAINIVPDDCTLTWMLRAASKVDGDRAERVLVALAAEVDARLKDRDQRAGAQLETLVDVPLFERGAMDTTFTRLTRQRSAKRLSFGTEAGIFSEAGHDVIVCGPGDMAQGHTVDEFIEIPALADGCRFIEDVIDEACT